MKRTVACLMMVGLVGALSVAGCSSNPVNEPTGGGGSGDASEYFLAEAKWLCGLLLTCCDASTDVGSLGWTQAECEQAVLGENPQEGWTEINQSIKAGRIVYNSAAGMECLAKYANDCTMLEGNSIYDDPLCLTVFVPQVADGGDCFNKEECATSTCVFAGATTGTCTPPAKVGESCGVAGCSNGLYCDSAAATPICKTSKVDGEPCTDSSMCVGDNCSFDTQTCITLAAVGEACTDSTQCASGTCDSATNTCAEAVISMCGK